MGLLEWGRPPFQAGVQAAWRSQTVSWKANAVVTVPPPPWAVLVCCSWRCRCFCCCMLGVFSCEPHGQLPLGCSLDTNVILRLPFCGAADVGEVHVKSEMVRPGWLGAFDGWWERMACCCPPQYSSLGSSLHC